MEATIKIGLYDRLKLRLDSYDKLIGSFDASSVVFKASKEAKLIHYVKSVKLDVLVLLSTSIDQEFREILDKVKRYGVNVIVVTTKLSKWLIPNLNNLGIRGYVVMEARPSSLEEAIYHVRNNQFYCCSEVSSALLGMSTGLQLDVSDREREIIKLIINDKSSKQIAEELCLSHHTISSHRKSILKKFNSKTTAGMVKKAIEMGFA